RVIGIGREVQARRKDGTLIDIDLSVAEVRVGDQIFFSGIVKDITERKRNERRLNWLATIVDSSNEAIIGLDRKLTMHSWNKAAERIFGYTHDEAIPNCIALLFSGGEQLEILQLIQDISDGRAGQSRIETCGLTRTGDEVELSLSIAPIIENDQVISGTSLIITDVTESREMQREIERTRAMATRTLNSLNESLALVDDQGHILVTNSAWNEFLEELPQINNQWGEVKLLEGDCFFVPERRSEELLWPPQLEIAARIRELLTDPEPVDVDQFIVQDAGAQKWFSVKLARLMETDSNQIVVAIDDITTEKQAQLDAQRAANAALAANVAKSEFLANMSHEIRTPLTAILGFTEILSDSDLDTEEQERGLQTIRRNGEHLLSIINEILDLSKIESGKLDIERTTCEVVQLIDDLDAMMNVRAKTLELEFETEFLTPLPRIIETDGIRLKQVLFNLLGNAAKFTSEGLIRLTVEKQTDATNRELLRFEVSDSGIGIDPKTAGKLFAPFTQADSSVSRKYGGTGLGLAICKRLVGLLGGTIGLTSTPGKGSTFWFTIEIGSPPSSTPVHSLEDFRREKRGPQAFPNVQQPLVCNILLAEDSPDSQRLFNFILTKAGGRVTIVNNGAEAVKEATNPANCFDVILMDMEMPVMDGYTATKILRQAGYRKPILALTAHAIKSLQDRCLRAGCDAIVTKPLDRHSLLEAVRHWSAEVKLITEQTLKGQPEKSF
ncbi:MAG: hypothetical protein CMJ46_03485, partial [Planctomyces sp.]|nr:hypothetical protein [Planctomyces sp.]